MEFLHGSIALLASMVLVLAGMVGWLYWQQTRLFQNMNSIVMVIGELARPVPQAPAPAPAVAEVEAAPESEEDDRATVEDEDVPAAASVETVSGPPEPIDTDSLEEKTTKDLRDMLTKRGIPYGKRDSKGVLISLLKATA
jgi:hypothetical protein